MFSTFTQRALKKNNNIRIITLNVCVYMSFGAFFFFEVLLMLVENEYFQIYLYVNIHDFIVHYHKLSYFCYKSNLYIIQLMSYL